MIDKKILEKVIKKAISKGFSYKNHKSFEVSTDCSSVVFFVKVEKKRFWSMHDAVNVYKLIFSQDFAKAFFGDRDFDGYYISKMLMMKACPRFEDNPLKEWQYHLEKMVLKEKPIQYLKQFLK